MSISEETTKFWLSEVGEKIYDSVNDIVNEHISEKNPISEGLYAQLLGIVTSSLIKNFASNPELPQTEHDTIVKSLCDTVNKTIFYQCNPEYMQRLMNDPKSIISEIKEKLNEVDKL